MRKVDTHVADLVAMIERGELRLPEMQRRYVWRAPRVRDLFDSLYRGYPSGSVLVWETDQPQPTRDLAVAQATSPFSGHKLLLDGQQRLTSLSAVLRGEHVHVRGRRKPIDILFNLEHPTELGEFAEVEGDEDSLLADDDDDDVTTPEEAEDEGESIIQERLRRSTFVVASNAIAALPNWVSVTEVFAKTDGDILRKAGVTGFDDPRYEKYTQRLARLRRIREYPYVMQVLGRDLDYEEVAEIFVRVNSLGAKLRGSDLALAQITARWPSSLKLLEAFQDECEERWFTFDLGLLVRAMVVFASHQSRFKSVANIPIERLKAGWEDAKRGLLFAINFLRSNANIEDESLLSSPLFVIMLAYISQQRNEKLGADEERELLYWLYVANARGRYSGSSETRLDEDITTIKKGGTATDLLDTVRRQFGRLDFDVTDLAGKNAQSPVFSLVFLALQAAGAKDWHSGLAISLTHQGKLHYIQYHHIFPRALVKKIYERKEVNEIANMAFISGRTNRRLGAKPPHEYLPTIVEARGEEALTSQCVPLEAELHQVDAYREFLVARREGLVGRMNAFLDGARQSPHSS